MKTNRKGVTNLVANSLIVLVIIFVLIMISIITSKVVSDVENPLIISKCKEANPVDKTTFLECVRLRTGNQEKAFNLIKQSPYAGEFDMGINGTCGTTKNYCINGTLSDSVASSSTYYWSCLGIYGGVSISCNVSRN